MTVSRRQSLFGGLALAGLATAARSQTPAGLLDDAAFAEVDRIALKAVANRSVPGLAVGVMRAGRMVLNRGYGFANLETRTPVTPETVFRMGSLIKQYTAASILLLAEDGKLSLDDPLSKFVPGFPRGGEVSLRRMLTHTSGLGDYTDAPFAQVLRDARLPYDTTQAVAAMQAGNPLFTSQPGTAYAYSNTAYVLLGVVIEKASGMPWPQFMRTRLFEKLALRFSAVDDDAEVVPNRASGYSPRAEAASGFRVASFIDPSFAGAGGALRATVGDLCAFHAALLEGRLLRPASFAAMTTAARLNDGSLPTREGADASAPRVPIESGMGLSLSAWEGRPVISHTGGIFGFQSRMTTLRNERITVAVVANTDDDGPDSPVRAITLAARSAALTLI